jgi:hypothetical protein
MIKIRYEAKLFLQVFSSSNLETKSNFKIQRIASHIIKVHASGAAASSTNTEGSEGENWLKRCDPRIVSVVNLTLFSCLLTQPFYV